MGIRGHRCLDLTQLDAEATHLDLEVGATQVLDGTVHPPLDEVTGTVQPRSCAAERIGDEALRREVRPTLVPAGNLGTREIELSCGADRDRTQVTVQHVGLGVPHRGSDRHRVEGVAIHLTRGRMHSELGGPVQVMQFGIGLRAERFRDCRRERFSRNENDAQADELVTVGFCDEHRQHRRNERRGRHLLTRDHVGEISRVAVPIGDRDHQRRAGCQCREELPHRHVECGGGLLQHDVSRVESVAVGDPGNLIQHGRVADGNALGAAGGTGGVDDICSVGGPELGQALFVTNPAGFDAAEIEVVDLDHLVFGGEREAVARHGEDAERAGAVEDVGRALRGVIRVEGYVRASCLHHRVHGHHRVEGATDGQGDLLLRSYSPPDQCSGEPIHARIELGVRQFRALEDEGRRVGRTRDLGVEQVDDRTGRRRHDVTVPAGHHLLAFLVAHRGQMRHRGVVAGAEKPLEEVEEPAVVAVQLVPGIQVGVRLEVDVDLAAGHALVDVQRQILDGARGQDVLVSGHRSQLDLAVEHHDVDRGAEEAALLLGSSGVPADVLMTVPLAAQCTRQLDLHTLDQFGDGHLRSDLETKRNDVRDHATGAAQRGGGTRRDGKTEDHVGPVRHVGEVSSERSHHDGGRTGISALQRLVEQGGSRLRQRLGREPREPAHHRCASGQTRGLGEVRGALGPVLTVLGEPPGAAVPLLVLDYPDKVLRTGCRRLGALDQRRVDLGDPGDECHGPEPVERDVVDPAEPEVVILADMQEVDHDEPVVEQVERCAVVAAHPLLCGVDRVVFGPEVDVRDGVVEGLVDVLVRNAVYLDESEETGTELSAGALTGLGQEAQVDIAAKLDVLGDGEGNVAERMLREPDTALRS
ncbi:hypothetical protein MLGJGCBP_02160 [Rhodococcus sp. T7]|nr:hypothetical protein MLGJGCBP_02160 [Rhodococcus sp. T7]